MQLFGKRFASSRPTFGQTFDGFVPQCLSLGEKVGQLVAVEPCHTREKMESTLLRHALCNCRHARSEADDLSIHSFSLLVGCAAFGEVYDLIAPLDCTEDDKEWCVSVQFLIVLAVFGTGCFQTHVLGRDATSLDTQSEE